MSAAPDGRAWSQRRIAGALVLAAWAGLFWFLIVAERVDLYLSTRTSWVVPMAAVVLSAAAVSLLVAGRAARPEPLHSREAVVMTLLVAPVVLLLALPPATLGSFSAPKKARFTGTGLATIYGRFDETSEVTFLAIAAGQTSDEGARLLATRAGSEVDLVGFVARSPDAPADELVLARYVVTCCAADASVVQVRVVNVTPGSFEPDDWIEVEGRVYPIGREVIVDARSIEEVPRPERPYLTP
jgi:uncharacterized repeat protein (TIGR03943 family)